MWHAPFLAAPILVLAVLYSSVGHGGGSGYLAAMALYGLPPVVMRPTALLLNVLVAAVATIQFHRAGCFSLRVFLPFAATSVPLAFVGGALSLSSTIYRRLVGGVLLVAGLRLAIGRPPGPDGEAPAMPRTALALPLGAAIGLLSGLTGVGGGIFLSPLLLLLRWADVRTTAAVSAAFVLINSVAGLLGNLGGLPHLSASVLVWGPAAVVGGLIGSELGRRRLATTTLRRVLALVLLVAAAKLALS